MHEANDPVSPPIFCSRADLALNETGQRQSTFDAFLSYDVARQRQKNLFIVPQVVVSKIDLQPSSSGTRAARVYFQRNSPASGGSSPTQFYASARQEIILYSGAIASPQVLMLRFVALVSLEEMHC